MRHALTLPTAIGPHLLRLAPRLPLALGAGPALVVAVLPLALAAHPGQGDAALLLRVTTVLCALPVAFALDDPAANTTAALPFPPALRRALRLALACAPMAVTWTACAFLLRAALHPYDRAALPLPGLALEAAGLTAAAVALVGLGLRLTGGERGSTLAAPGSTLLLLVLTLSPARAELFAVPYGESWTSSRWTWAAGLALGAGLAAALLREGRGGGR
ncbi:hypothetical protein IAG44_24445 [Streptomyces roseirectus]|uniref:ABC transporter n=1 Tax=Streptomyces roseirectus TaxID=2768066 RepID=A0A7H0IHI7_9ACTN|nr:hypothetical protein [Streptomyces roseirectus]QNP72253.1 hypothetical protein IAG44_24445 [Streptomyces roseirectus]